VFIGFILAAMATPQLGMYKQVIAIPLWLLIVFFGYKISRKKLHNVK
jgi:uncharacterized membrane protein